MQNGSPLASQAIHLVAPWTNPRPLLLLHNEPTDAYINTSNHCQESAEKKDLQYWLGPVAMSLRWSSHHLTSRTILSLFFPPPSHVSNAPCLHYNFRSFWFGFYEGHRLLQAFKFLRDWRANLRSWSPHDCRLQRTNAVPKYPKPVLSIQTLSA